MKRNISLLIFLPWIGLCFGQEGIINTDYMIFGRKEPASLGSVFSALGNEPIFLNPAGVALVTDNRITIGGNASDLGNGYMLSWTAPNISISSARHLSNLDDSTYREYKKEMLKFSFGISNDDLGYKLSNMALAFGISVKRLADRLTDVQNVTFGGDAIGVDLGIHISWQYLTFELTSININSPRLGNTDLSYARTFSICTRYRSPSGFVIAFQGLNSSTYAGSDFGINIAAQQSFMEHRLISRVQLTSFFNGTEATMQNISGNVGFRPEVPPDLYFLQDFEISYTLSLSGDAEECGYPHACADQIFLVVGSKDKFDRDNYFFLITTKLISSSCGLSCRQ